MVVDSEKDQTAKTCTIYWAECTRCGWRYSITFTDYTRRELNCWFKTCIGCKLKFVVRFNREKCSTCDDRVRCLGMPISDLKMKKGLLCENLIEWDFWIQPDGS